MWNARLERIEAIVEWQQRMAPERNDDRLFINRKNCRPGSPWTGRKIRNRGPLTPFRDRLLVDAVTRLKRPQAFFTILYCSTDCLSRRGAAVKNLTHSASFHSKENSAPSKSKIKHLAQSQNCSNKWDHFRHSTVAQHIDGPEVRCAGQNFLSRRL